MPTDTDIQHLRILRLLENKPHTSVEIAEHNILCPGKRISELRSWGFAIGMDWVEWRDSEGDGHRIGRYFYVPGQNDLNEKGKGIFSRL